MAWEFPSLLRDEINNYQSLPIPQFVDQISCVCLPVREPPPGESPILSAMCTTLFGRNQIDVLADENNRE